MFSLFLLYFWTVKVPQSSTIFKEYIFNFANCLWKSVTLSCRGEQQLCPAATPTL